MSSCVANLKELLYIGLTVCGIHRLFTWLNRKKAPILMYHGVVEGALHPFCWSAMPKEKLERQLAYFTRHYKVVSLTELARHLKDRASHRISSSCPIGAVTFDDGYRNNLTIAYPVLKKWHVPTTVFVTTGLVGTEELIWTDKIYVALKYATVQKIDLAFLGGNKLSVVSDKQKAFAKAKIAAMLKELGSAEKDRCLDKIVDLLCPIKRKDEDFFLLNWKEVKEISKKGLVTVGGHTVSHQVLTRCTPDQAMYEVTECLRTLKTYLGSIPLVFAYPNGNYDKCVLKLMKINRVFCAVSTEGGLNSFSTNVLRLRRISLGSDVTMARFKLEVSGFMHWVRCQRSLFCAILDRQRNQEIEGHGGIGGGNQRENSVQSARGRS